MGKARETFPDRVRSAEKGKETGPLAMEKVDVVQRVELLKNYQNWETA